MAGPETQRQQDLRRHAELKLERATWMPHWSLLSNFFLPRSGRYFVQDRNRGARRHNNIYDRSATGAVRVLAAGMMGGMTSPARPWFRLATSDQDLNKYAPVRMYLADVTRLMLSVFAKSNTYRALHTTYEELAVFGTSAKVVMDDYTNVIHHHSLTAGEYAIATDFKGNVDTLSREFEKTVAEVVGQFGFENCSTTVQNLYTRGTLGAWVPLIHLIEPRRNRDFAAKDAKNMAWRSAYFEVGAHDGKYLSESGFDGFPALCSRWSTSGGDIYGNSPGMEALGDTMQLQQQQLRKGQAIDYQTKPPLQAPAGMKNNEVDMLPGGVTYYDGATPGAGIRNAFEVTLNLRDLLGDMQDVRGRIREAFHTDMFLMLSDGSDTQKTAAEVAERHEEKLLMLGPTVERLHNEELNPLIESTFARMLKAGMLPPPPPELHGQELNVDFISMLAQAQRAIGTNSIDRLVGNLGAVAQIKPGVLDKFDEDKWIEEYSDALGVSPTLIVADDKVALIRKARAQAQQQAQQAEQMQQASQTAKNLAQAPTQTNNALTDVTRAFSGYT
jgi:hypothetical protein